MKVIQIVPQEGLALYAALVKKEAELRREEPADVLSHRRQEPEFLQVAPSRLSWLAESSARIERGRPCPNPRTSA